MARRIFGKGCRSYLGPYCALAELQYRKGALSAWLRAPIQRHRRRAGIG